MWVHFNSEFTIKIVGSQEPREQKYKKSNNDFFKKRDAENVSWNRTQVKVDGELSWVVPSLLNKWI